MKTLALALVLAMGGCCQVNRSALKTEAEAEASLMAELSAYVQADPKKTDLEKKAEAAKIKAHLDLFSANNGAGK